MLNSVHILDCSHNVNRELESEWVGWQDLAQDSSSYRMRVCVMQGMRTVLANHQTHSFLRPVLPFLVNQIHDVNEHVRIAVIQLLEYVKGHKSFKVCRREVDCNRIVVTASVDSSEVPICVFLIFFKSSKYITAIIAFESGVFTVTQIFEK